MFQELSLSAQAAYAEILDQSRSATINSLAALFGAFHVRTIKNKPYVYYGYRDVDGAGRMIYIGPHDERVKVLIEKHREEKSHQSMADLVKAAQVLGCQGMLPKHFKITQQLANYGFFKAGGILVGTHAFLAMGNMLGVKWSSGNKTLDVDFAHAGKNLSVALPANMKISVHDALTSLEMGLLPIQQLSGAAGAQYRNPGDQELRIDFLTSMGREKDNVVMNNLGIALEPLKFMEFSLEGTTQAVILSRNDACLVNIPAPERFAIHKLIVYGERKPADRVKAIKDVEQAAALVDWHVKNGLGQNVADAWDDAMSRGPGWRSRAAEGLKFMLSKHPELRLPGLWQGQAVANSISSPVDGELFSGRVVDVGRGVVKQKVGRDPSMIREHSAFALSRIPSKGEVVDIRYKDGVGEVSERAVKIER